LFDNSLYKALPSVPEAPIINIFIKTLSITNKNYDIPIKKFENIIFS